MLIQPDTYIRLIKNCPLDSTYNHTIYFNTELEQIGYFKNTLQGINFTKQSYQRYDKGVLQIQAPAETLYDCNYLMFQNTAFGNKYFYAFVTSIEYVNNVTSKITYEIDVMQTWEFNYEIGDCFIEREHSETDNVGDNLVPENLEIGEYISGVQNEFDEFQSTRIVIASTRKLEDNELILAPGQFIGGIFSGLYFTSYPLTEEGITAVKAHIRLDSLFGLGNSSIVSIFMMPEAFIADGIAPKIYDKKLSKKYGEFGSYTPKNNKLYTYPYNFLYVTDLQGNENTYRYEFFESESCKFYLGGDMSCNPGAILIPLNYKGSYINYEESVMVTGFPRCAYTDDSFAAYLAQITSASNIPRIGEGVSSQIGAFASTAGNVVGGALGGLGAIASILATSLPTLLKPPNARSIGNNSTLYVTAGIGLRHTNKRITEEFARIIDGFFNMYGYATHKVKKPNRNSRPHWNYVKTINCVIHGGVPANDLSAIERIYNNGITFWKNGSEIGDYSLDNRPV